MSSSPKILSQQCNETSIYTALAANGLGAPGPARVSEEPSPQPAALSTLTRQFAIFQASPPLFFCSIFLHNRQAAPFQGRATELLFPRHGQALHRSGRVS